MKKAIESDFDVNLSELNDVSMIDESEKKNVAIIIQQLVRMIYQLMVMTFGQI